MYKFECKLPFTLINCLQDSFKIDREQSSRRGDIEMGMNSGELGLQMFSKKVTQNYIAYVYLFLLVRAKDYNWWRTF